ncbi:MAG: transposase [Zavarzinella sp.]
MRAMLTPKIWAIFRPLVERAKRSAAGAKPKLTDLMFLEALLFLIRTGLPWRDLPSRFGDWNAVYQRFKRWRENNVFQRLFEDMPKDTPLENIKRIFIDSSVVRAHQHAAGGKNW